jgi:hypothetical protein
LDDFQSLRSAAQARGVSLVPTSRQNLPGPGRRFMPSRDNAAARDGPRRAIADFL